MFVVNKGLVWIYQLAPDKGYVPVSSTVTMAQCSPFNKMLLGNSNFIMFGLNCTMGCNHTSVE